MNLGLSPVKTSIITTKCHVLVLSHHESLHVSHQHFGNDKVLNLLMMYQSLKNNHLLGFLVDYTVIEVGSNLESYAAESEVGTYVTGSNLVTYGETMKEWNIVENLDCKEMFQAMTSSKMTVGKHRTWNS